jgi:hypothetical protein
MAANQYAPQPYRFGQQPEVDPMSVQGLRKDNRKQFMLDALRNATGLPEVALTMGTSLADMAGTGLGTLAGMAKQKLSGEKVNLDAATDTLQEGKFTFQPRSKGAQETLGGLATVTEPLEKGAQWAGQKTADVTGSPAAGAAVYTGLNILDPELLAPAAAKVAALRGGQNAARWAAQTASPMQRKGSPTQMGNQSGAYTQEDLAAVEGDYSMKSPTMAAFDRLKPQEQGRVSGKQLTKALQREGAKKEELYWMGLDKLLDTDELLSTADVRKIAEANQPAFEFKSQRGGEADDDAIRERVSDLVSESGDLEYPVDVTRDGDVVGTYDNMDEAKEAMKEMRDSYVEDNLADETQYQYDENLQNAFSEEELADMSESDKLDWAESEARSSLEETAREYKYEADYDYEADATNYDDVYSRIDDDVRNDPSSYGLEGGKPDYGEYTVGELGEQEDANYGVNVGRLTGEARYGKGYLSETDEMLEAGRQNNYPGQGNTTSPGRAYELEALRRETRDADPNRAKYTKNDTRSHYRDLGDNQMFFTRETDQPAPDWGTVQQGIGRDPSMIGSPLLDNIVGGEPGRKMPHRRQEEAQSDWYQAGRKTGWSDEKGLPKAEAETVNEQARIKVFQEQALNELPLALDKPEIRERFAEADADFAQAQQMGTEPSYDTLGLRRARDNYQSIMDDPDSNMGEKLAAARNVWTAVYRASPSGSPAEATAQQLMNALDQLPTMKRSPVESATASGPMRESAQFRKLALIDSLRRAVAEGQQYFSFTPGDIHAKRWGSDSVQYAADPDSRTVRYRQGLPPGAKDTDSGRTLLEAVQEKADQLPMMPGGGLGDFRTFDPWAPDAEQQAFDLVERALNYGMTEYPNPEKQMRKRADALLAAFRRMTPEVGPPTAPSHSSPRAIGFQSTYDPTADDLASIFKQTGSNAQLQPISDVPGEQTLGFEFDPALAQALKKGLLLPY